MSAAEPRDQHRAWHPRTQRGNGKPGFVMTTDELALAIAGARLERPVSWAVLWAIHVRQQRDFGRDQAVPISVVELCGRTGFSETAVHEALRELAKRGMVVAQRGGGRGRLSAYRLNDPASWQPAKGSASADPLEGKGCANTDRLRPERVRAPRSASAPPLSIPPLEQEERQGNGEQSRAAVVAHDTRSETPDVGLRSPRDDSAGQASVARDDLIAACQCGFARDRSSAVGSCAPACLFRLQRLSATARQGWADEKRRKASGDGRAAPLRSTA